MTESHFVLDACHDRVRVGDIVIASYRGAAAQRFEILADDGGGLFKVRRPDGEQSLMRPSTILSVADHIIRDGERIETPNYVRGILG